VERRRQRQMCIRDRPLMDKAILSLAFTYTEK
jgi:hypothetical protein